MVSGAAGVYVGMLVEDAGISTDLVVTPGQSVTASGDPSLPEPPLWGRPARGGFTVEERGSLALDNVALESTVSVRGGGSASLSDCAPKYEKHIEI